MKILLLFLMGITAGAIDTLPMVKMKIDRYSISSAFLFHLIAPFILYFLETDIVFWLKGGLVYLLLAVPTIVLVARDDKKSVPIMCISSLTIGTIIGAMQHLFL